jgi:hypothetical protein
MTKRLSLCLFAVLLGTLAPAAATAGGSPAGEPPPYRGGPQYDEPQFDGPPNGGGFGIRAAAAACRPDIERYCAGVLPGGGRIIACLAGNRDRLTPPCEDVLRRAESFFRR